MTGQLQIKELIFYVIFYDGSHIKISARQHEHILNTIDEKPDLIINKAIYKSNSISKIISEDDYFDQYPDQKPQILTQQRDDNYKTFNWQKVDSKKALGQMIKGFERVYQENGRDPKESQVYKQMQKKI